MIVTMTSGRMTAEAETVDDVRAILAIGKPKVAEPKEPRKYSTRGKQKCPICGKKRKQLAHHIGYMHKEPEVPITRL